MKQVLIMLGLFTLISAQAEEKKFSNESSLSIVETGGNAVSEAYNLATDTSYKPGGRDYRFYGNYTLSYADDPKVQGIEKEETARNWIVGAEVTQDLSKKLGLIVGQNVEGNEFTGFERRENSDIGLKYQFSKTDDLKASFEMGYRYTFEKRTTSDDDGDDEFYFNKANIVGKIDQKLTETTRYSFMLQYLPNFTESEDYQINFEPALTVKMSTIFSLKVSYRGQYDNQLNPGVEEYLDHTTTTALVAKY
tara:strand:+ start:17665 stop:18414 length:750 start_codon:yes stop_codon:yes gene_type:complete